MNKLLEIIRYIKSKIPQAVYPDIERTITLIDPGHGGIVDGVYVTAPSKMTVFPEFTFYEGVFNRALAWTYALRLFERNLGYHIIVTEDDDTSLIKRTVRANSVMNKLADIGKKCYYHSIHANAFKDSRITGIEVYTSPGHTPSDIIASSFYKYLKGMGWIMRPDNSDGDVDKEERFFVLTQTKMPAILTETGFYTNQLQADLMRDQETINKLADLFLMAHLEITTQKIKYENKNIF